LHLRVFGVAGPGRLRLPRRLQSRWHRCRNRSLP
jgi:hypothetical protein